MAHIKKNLIKQTKKQKELGRPWMAMFNWMDDIEIKLKLFCE